MKKLYERTDYMCDTPFYFGIWSYNGHVFKITSTLKGPMSVWHIDVRTNTGKWVFETGNLIFKNTPANYTIEDAPVNVKYAFDSGIQVATEYITTVY